MVGWRERYFALATVCIYGHIDENAQFQGYTLCRNGTKTDDDDDNDDDDVAALSTKSNLFQSTQ